MKDRGTDVTRTQNAVFPQPSESRRRKITREHNGPARGDYRVSAHSQTSGDRVEARLLPWQARPCFFCCFGSSLQHQMGVDATHAKGACAGHCSAVLTGKAYITETILMEIRNFSFLFSVKPTLSHKSDKESYNF